MHDPERHARRWQTGVLWLLLPLALATPPTRAVDGFFDTTFGFGGRHTVAVAGLGDDQAYRLDIARDGRLLLAGMCLLPQVKARAFCTTRLRADGTGYDPTFGPGGLGYLTLHGLRGFPDGYFSDMALFPDGRIVMTGLSEANDVLVAVVRSISGSRGCCSISSSRMGSTEREAC